MENITDIIKGCIDKNHQYQKIFYEQYYGYALKIVFRYIYRYEKAVDVVNDGFVKLFRNFEKFQLAGESDNERILMGWMKRILVNTAIDELRKGSMLNQYQTITDGTQRNLTGTYNNMSLHSAASLKLSIGYEKNIHKAARIRLEPYIQIPLKGIGVGSMPVTTAGVHIGFFRLAH